MRLSATVRRCRQRLIKPQGGAVISLSLALLFVLSCAGKPLTEVSTGGRQSGSTAQKTLVVMNLGEAPVYSSKKLLPGGVARVSKAGSGEEFLNADLTFRDGRGNPYPVLAEALPQVNTSSWKVFPDGKMETTFLLRPNLTWHDGQPLTSGDFAFAAQVYATPEFGVSKSGAFRFIDEVQTPDSRTVVIRWTQSYPEALWDDTLPPLPRHILGESFRQLPPDGFMTLSFWTAEYIGAGPWKLERREPGSFFEASAFDGFVFGRPRIDRVKVLNISDTNVALAAMLAGEVHLAPTGLFKGEEGITLERAWASNRGGVVLWEAPTGRGILIQARPEVAAPAEMATDPRVRRALAHLIDKASLIEVITAGKGVAREIYTGPGEDAFDTVNQAVKTRYPYDPVRSRQLLDQAQFVTGADGLWVTPGGKRVTLELWYSEGSTNARESLIMADTMRQVGIDASSHQLPVQGLTPEGRATTPGLFAGSLPINGFHTRDIAGPANRWAGNNRGGYSNLDLDPSLDIYATALNSADRLRALIEVERVLMDDLPAIPLYWTPSLTVHVASLKGIPGRHVQGTGVERRNWEWYWE